MSGNQPFYAGGGDTGFRRTWDRDEFARRARIRDEDARNGGGGALAAKSEDADAPLQARDGTIDFEKLVNRTSVVGDATAPSAGGGQSQPGFFCAVCNTLCKDNINYLDHLNGFKHQKNLGMSMKVERSTVEQVKARIEMWADKRKNPEKETTLAERVQKAIDQEESAKLAKKEEKRRKKEEEEEKRKNETELMSAGMDPGFAAMMGFSGFGTSKK